MTLFHHSAARVVRAGSALLAGAALLCIVTTPALAQVRAGAADALSALPMAPPLIYVVPLGSEISTLYYDGEQIEIQSEDRWRFMCGSDCTGKTVDDLAAIAEAHYAAFANGPAVIIDSGTRGAGINIVYNTNSSVPTEAIAAFSMAEAYIEEQFSDPITVTISCSFASMGGSILGGTSSSYNSNISWTNSRNGLLSGMDGDDVIQNYLPTGSTIPVRYNGGSSTVTNESAIDWTKADYRATIGSTSGTAANMQFNTDFTWDYDPSNGVSGGRTSFVDVVVHETGHALGFTSAVDGSGNQMEAMDIFRFQRTDGAGDYNPDTYAEFQTRARLVDYNTPNDDHNTDLISAEYRMEDGSPYQGSHLRQANNQGIMCPALSAGSTRYPNFYSSVDLAIFDALGYDYPPGSNCLTFLSQPTASQTLCDGDTASLSVSVQDPALMDYQWRKGAVNLVDDGSHIFGATTDTLIIVGFGAADEASDYNCLVTNTSLACSFATNDAELLLDSYTPVITSQPVDETVTEGDPASFSVSVQNAVLNNFQWYKGAASLSDDGHFFGTDTGTLVILSTTLGDAGDYHCVVTAQLGSNCALDSGVATLTVNAAGNNCPEDLNGDGAIGLSDLSILLANYGATSGMGPSDGDFDGDGDIDLSDLSQLLAVYGQNCPTH